MNTFKKLIYLFKKPRIIIYDNNLFLEKFSKTLFEKETLFPINEKDKLIKFLIKHSKKPIVILNNKNSIFEEIVSYSHCFFVLNADFFRRKEEYPNILTYGTRIDADFNVSDINISSEEINFKLTYKGSSVPFWVNGEFKEEDVKIISGIIAVSVLTGMNLVEISEKIKKTLF